MAQHDLFLLLGSNIGNREEWLRVAREHIQEDIGEIVAASRIYETAAWGKEDQAPFLNQALRVAVRPSVTAGLSMEEAGQVLLAKTSSIERHAGRERSNRWAPRTLDIDLLLWGDLSINAPNLTIPHPAFPQRRFALEPLAEVAADVVHPAIQKTIGQLLQDCTDPLGVEEFHSSAANQDTAHVPHSPYIAIEGVIGAGKTTLAHKLAAHYGTEPILEAFTENVFLPRFYADPQRYALPVELHFLTDRYQQLQKATAAERTAPLVADYTFVKCLLFAGVTLPEEEALLYARLFAMAELNLPKPDIIIYLQADVTRLQHSIRQRGRAYEQSIPDEYLTRLAAAYEAWLPTAGCPVIYIDTGKTDYLNDEAIFQGLVNAIESGREAGVHPFSS